MQISSKTRPSLGNRLSGEAHGQLNTMRDNATQFEVQIDTSRFCSNSNLFNKIPKLPKKGRAKNQQTELPRIKAHQVSTLKKTQQTDSNSVIMLSNIAQDSQAEFEIAQIVGKLAVDDSIKPARDFKHLRVSTQMKTKPDEKEYSPIKISQSNMYAKQTMPTSTGLRSSCDTGSGDNANLIWKINDYAKGYFVENQDQKRQFSTLSKGQPSVNLSDHGHTVQKPINSNKQAEQIHLIVKNPRNDYDQKTRETLHTRQDNSDVIMLRNQSSQVVDTQNTERSNIRFEDIERK